ncbi:MAG: DUF1956 domain-containing protein [Phycisphaera sp.]|nr:DUF1956 domain-containing protein [Phycisphaera sp.]
MSTSKTPIPSTKPGDPTDGPDNTTARLLDAAERLFSEKGYAATSVRDITQTAGCNIAAINYHFGGKTGLYEAMFDRRLQTLRDQRITAVRTVVDEAVAKGQVEPVLRAFAYAFMAPFIDTQRGPVTARLLMREILDPHLPRGMVLNRMIQPIHETMIEALTRVCPWLSIEESIRCLHSLVGQLVHLIMAWKIFDDAEHIDDSLFDVDRAVDHVVAFSSAGIRSYDTPGGASGSQEGVA